jgi:hypothetical protein
MLELEYGLHHPSSLILIPPSFILILRAHCRRIRLLKFVEPDPPRQTARTWPFFNARIAIREAARPCARIRLLPSVPETAMRNLLQSHGALVLSVLLVIPRGAGIIRGAFLRRARRARSIAPHELRQAILRFFFFAGIPCASWISFRSRSPI